jgi:hypothetical protein
LSADILNHQKYLQALDKAVGSLAHMSHDSISLLTYLDSMEFVCKVLWQHANAVWKSFSEGEAIHYSGNMDSILTTLHQFIDSSLKAYRYACKTINIGTVISEMSEHLGINALLEELCMYCCWIIMIPDFTRCFLVL